MWSTHAWERKTDLQLAIGEARIGVSHAWEIVVSHGGGDVRESVMEWIGLSWRRRLKERKNE